MDSARHLYDKIFIVDQIMSRKNKDLVDDSSSNVLINFYLSSSETYPQTSELDLRRDSKVFAYAPG